MDVFSNVKIPVFAETATSVAWTDPVSAPSPGVYYTDEDWLKPTNATRVQGVVEGIARSVDYNTVLRQCSIFARLFANILAYRNGTTRTGVTPYGGSKTTPIGTDVRSGEGSLEGHIGALSNIFDTSSFLADNEVTTRTISSLAVTTAKIAASAVTTAKINNEAITIAKLGSGLVSTGSASANGITVTLSQSTTSNARGFVVGITSSKVTTAQNADYATEADKLKTAKTTTKLFLCGTTAVADNTRKPFYNSESVYVQSGTQLNASSFNVPSDRRLKENIKELGEHQVRALVEGVKVVTYNYKKDKEKKTTLGVVAQDIQEVNAVLGDLLVFKDEDTGMLGLHEDKLVYVLWNYVQQQNKRICELEEKVRELSK